MLQSLMGLDLMSRRDSWLNKQRMCESGQRNCDGISGSERRLQVREEHSRKGERASRDIELKIQEAASRAEDKLPNF